MRMNVSSRTGKVDQLQDFRLVHIFPVSALIPARALPSHFHWESGTCKWFRSLFLNFHQSFAVCRIHSYMQHRYAFLTTQVQNRLNTGVSENIVGLLKMDWQPGKSRHLTPAKNLPGKVCLPFAGQVLKGRNSTSQSGGATWMSTSASKLWAYPLGTYNNSHLAWINCI